MQTRRQGIFICPVPRVKEGETLRNCSQFPFSEFPITSGRVTRSDDDDDDESRTFAETTDYVND